MILLKGGKTNWKYILIVVIWASLIGGGVWGWRWWVLRQEKKPSTEVQVYKGVWLPMISALNPSCLACMIPKLKDMGVNAVFLSGLPPGPLENQLPLAKEHIIANMQTAHQNGLRVVLTISIDPKPKREEIDLETLNSRIIEYAKLAEEYDVELFAPLGEPEGWFDDTEIEEWGQEILLRIKEVYHGEVVWMGCGTGGEPRSEEYLKELSEGPPGRYAGYDYIGFGVNLVPGMALEEFPQYVDDSIRYKLAQAERDNSKGIMITEFGVHPGPEQRSEEEVARAHEIVLEKGKDRVAGFFVAEWAESDCAALAIEELKLIFGQPEEVIMAKAKESELRAGKTKEVIRRWFKEILP